MALPFSLGAVTELFVVGYDGFDRGQSATMVRVLGTGTSLGDEVMQQTSRPFRQASLSGVSYVPADIALMRTYNDTKQLVTFTDGDGESYAVRVLDFGARSMTGRWLWTMTLVSMESVVLAPAPVPLVLRIQDPAVTVS